MLSIAICFRIHARCWRGGRSAAVSPLCTSTIIALLFLFFFRSFQARPSNPKTGRPILVHNWCPKVDLRLQVELAQPADFSLVREFMLNEARPRDAAALTGKKAEVEIEGFLTDMADRSTRTPTSALIFHTGSSELLGIVAASVIKLPDTRTRMKFVIPPDCKERESPACSLPPPASSLQSSTSPKEIREWNSESMLSAHSSSRPFRSTFRSSTAT